MAVTLMDRAIISTQEALRFLQDQGSPVDANDLLRMHINAVTAMMEKETARDRLAWVDDDTITEYRDGECDERLYLRNAPLVKIVSVTLYPHDTSLSTSIEVPTEGTTFSDEMYLDPHLGMIVLKNRVFPEGPSQVKVEYEAGYVSTDGEYKELQMIALNILARKWARWKGQRHGVASENRGETSITYTADDVTKSERAELRRYRRTMFA